MIPLLENSDGKKSASFTMMIVAFVVVTVWCLLSITQKVGPFAIRPFSGAEAMAYLTPLVALYFGRKQQELGAAAQTLATTKSLEASDPETPAPPAPPPAPTE